MILHSMTVLLTSAFDGLGSAHKFGLKLPRLGVLTEYATCRTFDVNSMSSE